MATWRVLRRKRWKVNQSKHLGSDSPAGPILVDEAARSARPRQAGRRAGSQHVAPGFPIRTLGKYKTPAKTLETSAATNWANTWKTPPQSKGVQSNLFPGTPWATLPPRSRRCRVFADHDKVSDTNFYCEGLTEFKNGLRWGDMSMKEKALFLRRKSFIFYVEELDNSKKWLPYTFLMENFWTYQFASGNNVWPFLFKIHILPWHFCC